MVGNVLAGNFAMISSTDKPMMSRCLIDDVKSPFVPIFNYFLVCAFADKLLYNTVVLVTSSSG